MGVIQKIIGSIDVTKIDKSRIKDHSNGSKYYNVEILVMDEFNQFNNNVAICQGQTKEEREAKEKGVFIGNGRVIFDSRNKQAETAKPKNTPTKEQPTDDDLPF